MPTWSLTPFSPQSLLSGRISSSCMHTHTNTLRWPVNAVAHSSGSNGAGLMSADQRGSKGQKQTAAAASCSRRRAAICKKLRWDTTQTPTNCSACRTISKTGSVNERGSDERQEGEEAQENEEQREMLCLFDPFPSVSTVQLCVCVFLNLMLQHIQNRFYETDAVSTH